MQKKKVVVVAQTHWDKEWYFNEQTSHVNLQRLVNDIKTKWSFPFHLDGQSSILADVFYGNKHEATEFVKENKLSAGPLFAQQDSFSVLFGTTQNNIELTKRIVDEEVISKTVYIPDSFGYNEQMPQIFKKNNFNQFVFWRGIRPEDKNKSNLFNWVGVDGTKMKTHCMVDGYWIMGSHFPYYGEQGKDDFDDDLIAQVQKLESYADQNIYVIPLGGDQAPVPLNVDVYIERANKKQNKYHFILGGYDEYFAELKENPKEEIDYMLYYSGVSKIHRTVHSNRYDIKKAYREVEISVFYRMEPLEIIYKKMGGILIDQKVKDNRIYKPLILSSGHDALCGCNVDLTNKFVLNRLTQVKEFVESYIDQMLRDIRENIDMRGVYVAFNQAPFKRDLIFKDIISTNSSNLVTSESNEIFEYDCNDLSNGNDANVFMHKVWIVAKEVEPFSWKIIKVKETMKIAKSQECSKVKFDDDSIVLPNGKSFEVILEDDFGDEFDFSTNQSAKKEVIGNWKTSKSLTFNDSTSLVRVRPEKYPELEMSIFSIDKKHFIDIELDNKFSDKRISIEFTKKSVELSRHLAFMLEKLDNIRDWKNKGYKDFPCNVFPNDGLVRVDDKYNILTKGTNEVWIDDSKASITLARFVGLMGKPNLDYRPGVTSGLPFRAYTPEAQLHKQLEFNLQINSGNPIKTLNEWYFDPIGFYSKHANPTVERIDKFLWNNRLLDLNKKIDLSIDADNLLIGMLKLDNDKISLAYSNPLMKDNCNLKKAEIVYEKSKI